MPLTFSSRLFCTFLLVLLPLFAASRTFATEMIYSPVNPAFGGNPFNAAGLMGIAQAQNSFTATPLSPAESFNLSLQRAILSRLTSQTLNSLFGPSADNPRNTLQDHTYDTIGYTINVKNDNDAGTVTITTTDKTSGATTSFIVNNATP